MHLMPLARDERTDFAAFLATLSPPQWEAPSLCQGWRVRDVVAHVISYDELDGQTLFRRMAKGRFLPNRANAIGLVHAQQPAGLACSVSVQQAAAVSSGSVP